MQKKKLEELNKWKKYDVKVLFRELKPKKGEVDYQMLLYFNDDLVYTTRKNSFKLVKYKVQKLKSIKKLLFNWKDFDDFYEVEYEDLRWQQEEFKKFNKWCSNFRMCTKIMEAVQKEKERLFRRKLNLQ